VRFSLFFYALIIFIPFLRVIFIPFLRVIFQVLSVWVGRKFSKTIIAPEEGPILWKNITSKALNHLGCFSRKLIQVLF
jgi:hypothetical protein